MKRSSFILLFCFLTFGLSQLMAEDFRVEWLSGRSIHALKFEAGADTLRLCSQTQKSRCLVLQPRSSAACTSLPRALRCQTKGALQSFTGMTASSLSPFRLEATISKSRHGESQRSGEARNVEVLPTPRGPRVVLVTGLEIYVAGVLTGEAGVMRSESALEAMAMVARTWALRSRGRHRREGFDFCSLTHCQVFSPPPDSADNSRPEFAAAMRNTNGKVVKFNGLLIDPYFSADCGGMTESAGELWPDRAAPYLVSVRDPYCAGSQHSSWRQTIRLNTLTEILHTDLHTPFLGTLHQLKVERRDASGRAQILRLLGDSFFEVNANEFRYAINRRLGWNTLKSNLYSVELRGDTLVFTGRGLGHGVGLCQAGAERMGQLKISSDKILAAYFPGINISDMAVSKSSDPVLSSEHFQLIFPDSQQPWVNATLRSLEAARSGIETRAGQLPSKIRVETFGTTPDFVRSSNQPGWTAAFTDGTTIQLQPLSTLKRKGILESTLRHELAHLAVHQQRSTKVPRWFEEGLVLWMTGEKAPVQPSYNLHGKSLEDCISKPGSEAEMKAAYALALERVRKKATESGRSKVWQILRNPSEDDLRWLKNQ